MTDNGRSADPRKSSKVPTISTECRDFRRESVVCVLRVRGVFSRAGRRSRFTVSLAASAHRAAAQAAEVAEGRGGSVRICARRVAACERQHTQVSRDRRTDVTRDGNRRITETYYDVAFNEERVSRTISRESEESLRLACNRPNRERVLRNRCAKPFFPQIQWELKFLCTWPRASITGQRISQASPSSSRWTPCADA